MNNGGQKKKWGKIVWMTCRRNLGSGECQWFDSIRNRMEAIVFANTCTIIIYIKFYLQKQEVN